MSAPAENAGARKVSHRSRRATIPHSDAPYGTCRWCGDAILRDDGTPNRRRNWHPECVEEYKNSWPHEWRRAVGERDGGVCAACPAGTPPHERWEADHVLPLIDGGDWSLGNAQTLCRAHHREKTAAENSRRAQRENMLAASIKARLLGNSVLGLDDPYPFDVESRAKYEAYLALGGTEAEAQAEWRRAYDATAQRDGGGRPNGDVRADVVGAPESESA